MKLDRNTAIGGQPVKVVRDMLRELPDEFSAERVEHFLRKTWWRNYIDELIAGGKILPTYVSWKRAREMNLEGQRLYGGIDRIQLQRIPDQRAAAEKLIAALSTDGYIEESRRDPTNNKVIYCCTMKGGALGLTRLVRRMNRAKAEALLKDMLARVAEINAKAELLHWITEIRIFGSYLTDTDDIGDLDVAIRLERHKVDGKWSKACNELADKSGKTLYFLERLTYPKTELFRRIKNRSPYISLHEMAELEENREQLGDGKTVYTFTPPQKRQ